MRVIVLPILLLAATAQPVLAQGSLKDLGKSVLQQQMGSGGGASLPSSVGGTRGQGLSAGDIASGLKEALKVGTEKVSGQLGRADGYNRDPQVHIPLPDSLQKVQSGLKMAGMSGMADELELKLNRAAEAAAPEAKRIFWNALDKMSLDDAKGILNGPQDAATQYFKRTMTPDLKTAMRPVVDRTVADAGAVKSYESLTASAKGLPMVGDGRTMLTDHVLEQGLSGLFTYLGREEAAIRSDPTKRTSDILRKVFAN
jgi:hypothetical protein